MLRFYNKEHLNFSTIEFNSTPYKYLVTNSQKAQSVFIIEAKNLVLFRWSSCYRVLFRMLSIGQMIQCRKQKLSTNNQLEREWNEVVFPFFQAQPLYIPGSSEQKHRSQCGQSILGLRFESLASRTWRTIFNPSTSFGDNFYSSHDF